MRGALLVPLIAACGFSPTIQSQQGTDGPGADTTGAGSNAGSGSGSGSGSGMCPDADGDGICDAVDDWPCGVKPADPSANGGEINIGGGWQWSTSATKTQNLDTRLAVIAANQSLSVGFAYTLRVTCAKNTSCRAQLEWGTDTAGKLGCVYDNSVTGDSLNIGTANGTWNNTFTIATPGRYELRLQPAKASSCTPAWAGAAPDSGATIAIVCVHP